MAVSVTVEEMYSARDFDGTAKGTYHIGRDGE